MYRCGTTPRKRRVSDYTRSYWLFISNIPGNGAEKEAPRETRKASDKTLQEKVLVSQTVGLTSWVPLQSVGRARVLSAATGKIANRPSPLRGPEALTLRPLQQPGCSLEPTPTVSRANLPRPDHPLLRIPDPLPRARTQGFVPDIHEQARTKPFPAKPLRLGNKRCLPQLWEREPGRRLEWLWKNWQEFPCREKTDERLQRRRQLQTDFGPGRRAGGGVAGASFDGFNSVVILSSPD
ncbi:uncharacterized protein LOC132671013 [Panthera onca]